MLRLGRKSLFPPTQILPRAFTSIPRSQALRTREIFVPGVAASIPYRWLRDSCRCSACIHPTTRQKLHRTSDIPSDVHPKETTVSDDELRIIWEQGSCSSDKPSLHESVYALEWLKTYATPENRKAFHRDKDRITWTSSQLRNMPHLFVDYAQLQDDDCAMLFHAVTQLLQCGIVFVKGVPTGVKGDAGCDLRQLAARFGRIRNTFYGEVWDVKSVKNSTNIAYTNLDLGLHMDLLYFQHPPRYQILHSLRNRVQGGTSIFVDAICTAHKLHNVSPSTFEVLSRTPITYHYINNGHHMHHAHPVISLSPFPSRMGPPGSIPAIEYINYSPPFQAPLPIGALDVLYDALKVFAELLEEDQFEYTLKEGEAVIFDNRRVLHARTEFKEIGIGFEGETSRWLKGCYLEEDDILDLRRNLAERREEF